MANPISTQIKIGTIGELLVQLRLLEYGIQAVAPHKDSGNDLIGVKGQTVKFIQVKTTSQKKLPARPNENSIYDLLFVVSLKGTDIEIKLDQSEIFVLTKEETTTVNWKWKSLEQYRFSKDHCGFE